MCSDVHRFTVQYRSAVDGLLKIHKLGITHGDFYPRNTIVESPDSKEPAVVIIDPRPRWDDPDWRDERHWVEFAQFYKAVSDLVPCCCDDYEPDSFYNSVPNKPKLPHLPGTLKYTGNFS